MTEQTAKPAQPEPQPTKPIDPTTWDTSVPIGNDFYRHVNGGWLDANPVPPEYGAWGAFHEVNSRNQELLHVLLQAAAANPGPEGTPGRMVGDYFAAGMDEAAIAAAGTAPLLPFLQRIDAAETLADVREIARDLQHSGVGVLHSLGVEADFESSDAYLVYLGQGGLGLPERDYYLRDDERSTGLREAYVGHVTRQLGNLGLPADEAASAAAAILAFETKLAEASYPAEKMRDVQLTLNRLEIGAVDDLMPGFGLAGYLHELGATQPTMCVDNPGFFTALSETLEATPIETLRHYLRWQLVRALASSLPAAFEQEHFEFFGKLLGGQQKMLPRWKRILNAAGADIGEQVSQLFVAAAFPPSAKERCEELVEHLFHAMGRAIRTADWMTEPTREEALTKLAGFTYKIGYPDKWRDYSGLRIERGAHVENRIRAAVFEHDRVMSRLDEPVDRTEWAMPAHAVNAYYHPLHNEIVFPAGILQPPFFWAEADDAVNFGGIGCVIGHEITHGFDDQGSRFDANGALRDWWSEADRAEFERRAEIVVAQFDGYVIEDGLTVNGRLTLGENIADLGGVTVSFDALHEALAEAGSATEAGAPAPLIDGLTPEQRFFLAHAQIWHTNYTPEAIRLMVNVDPHSPAHFRVNGPLSNFAPFAAAFGIADGSPMVRGGDLRAKIW